MSCRFTELEQEMASFLITHVTIQLKSIRGRSISMYLRLLQTNTSTLLSPNLKHLTSTEPRFVATNQLSVFSVVCFCLTAADSPTFSRFLLRDT